MGVHGIEKMYLLEDVSQDQLVKLSSKPGWLEQSIRVMDGDFTVSSDRHVLVNVILGLYGLMILSGNQQDVSGLHS